MFKDLTDKHHAFFKQVTYRGTIKSKWITAQEEVIASHGEMVGGLKKPLKSLSFSALKKPNVFKIWNWFDDYNAV